MKTIKRRLIGCLLAAAMLFAGSASASEPVVIGSTNFQEQLVLAHIYAEVLQARGVPTKLRLNLGSREVVFPALKAGDIDVLPEYTGAMLGYLTNGQSTAVEPATVARAARRVLPAGLVMLELSKAQDKDAFVVRPETAKRYQLENLSDLKGTASKLVLGGPPELKTRHIGVPGLKQVYGVQFKAFRSLDAGGPLTEAALESASIDVGLFFTTQGIIDAKGWKILRDDRRLISAQNLVPVARRKALTPAIRRALNAVSARLDTQALRRLNRKVSIDKYDPAQVAARWVHNQGLASRRADDGGG